MICIPVKEANVNTMRRIQDFVHQIVSEDWKTVENSVDVRVIQGHNVQIVLHTFVVVWAPVRKN